MQITSSFDGGNIKVLDIDDPENIQLEILPDSGTGYFQWFYFRLTAAKDIPSRMKIMNAKDAFAGGWEGYRAVVSDDRETWFRVNTTYSDGVLTISHTPKSNSIYVAFFAPYGLERNMDLISRALHSGLADLKVLGQTLDGHDLDLLTVGNPSGNSLIIWITARQHPGETMASWWMEGFLERLLSTDCEVAASLREQAAFFIVPNMNPDGCYRGHLRTNAVGVDLNRAWKSPSLSMSPEVHLVRQLMFQTRPDLSFDIHGTEAIPHAFIVGPEGPAGKKEPVASLINDFKNALLKVNLDFQTKVGFDTNSDDIADAIGTNYQGEVFQSLCMTLEMPFSDTSHTPDLEFGWSPARAKKMGRDCLEAMLMIAPRLHLERKKWR